MLKFLSIRSFSRFRVACGGWIFGIVMGIPGQLHAQGATQAQAQRVTACRVLKARLPSSGVMRTSSSPLMDTRRIQSALSLCQPGEALVLTSDGAKDSFVSAPLILPRGVVLFVAKGVTLYASRNPRDYDLWPESCGVQGAKRRGCKPFLFAYQAAFSGVLGDGTIDGQGGLPASGNGDSWWKRTAQAQASGQSIQVPDLISSYESQSFTVRGVHLQNAAGSHLSLYKTIGFRGNNIAISTPASAVGASGVLLSNSPDAMLTSLSIQVSEVALDLRGSILGGTSRVKVDGLRIRGGEGISLGDDVYGSTADIQINHASLQDTARGFTFNLRGTAGGHLHNIHVQDACLSRVALPLVMEQRSGAPQGQLLPNLDISFDGVTIAGLGTLDSEGVKPDRTASCSGADATAATAAVSEWELDLSAAGKSGKRSKLLVASDGSGNFTSIQEAVEALPDAGGEIDVKPGTYREVVTIRKPHVRLHGEESDPAKTVVVYNNTGPRSGGTFNSATLFVEADDVSIDHLTIANDAGSGKGQAVALAVTADRADFRNIRLLGAQDTLFAAAKYCYGDYGPCVPARQYFKDCYIAGNVDFIFGDSKAVFDHCELHGIAGRNVMYTAQGKHYAEQESGYIFDHCRLTADPAAGSLTLGRPWRPHATVVYLDSIIDAPVIAAGWTEWRRLGEPSLPIAWFAEYRSSGEGASPSTREPFSHQLSEQEAAEWSPKAFLAGKDGWNPLRGR